MNKKVTTVLVAPQLTEQLNQQVLEIIEIAKFWQVIHGPKAYKGLKCYLQLMQRQSAGSEDFVSHFDQDERIFFMQYMQDLEKVTKLMCSIPSLVSVLENQEPIAQTA